MVSLCNDGTTKVKVSTLITQSRFTTKYSRLRKPHERLLTDSSSLNVTYIRCSFLRDFKQTREGKSKRMRYLSFKISSVLLQLHNTLGNLTNSASRFWRIKTNLRTWYANAIPISKASDFSLTSKCKLSRNRAKTCKQSLKIYGVHFCDSQNWDLAHLPKRSPTFRQNTRRYYIFCFKIM